MLRTSTSHRRADGLTVLLQQTCYGDRASEVAALMRAMILTYHNPSTSEGDRQAADLSSSVPKIVPIARLVSLVGLDETYEVEAHGKVYRFTWQRKIARGCYNSVYNGTMTDVRASNCRSSGAMPLAPVVVKVTGQHESDLRVFVLENVLHAILFHMPETRGMVVPIWCPFKVPHNDGQVNTYGVVLSDPGHGHVGEYIERKYESFERHGTTYEQEMFSMLASIADMLYRARALRFEHRDLKADNIMWAPTSQRTRTVHIDEQDRDMIYPTCNASFVFIDFGMARFEYAGEYLACDCLPNRTEYNPACDLQNLCCTLVEDYAQELAKIAPRFFSWLQGLCKPLFAAAAARTRGYAKLDRDARHLALTDTVHAEKLRPFVPISMLEILRVYFDSKTVA